MTSISYHILTTKVNLILTLNSIQPMVEAFPEPLRPNTVSVRSRDPIITVVDGVICQLDVLR